jgi:hypothetical protein
MFGSVGKTWSADNIYNQRGKKSLKQRKTTYCSQEMKIFYEIIFFHIYQTPNNHFQGNFT